MKKDYYIQGDPARGKEIKAAFEAKGIDTASFSLDHDEFLYYSSNGLLYYEDFSNALLNVFKTNPGYTELPLSAEPKFKVGDWVVKKDGKTFYGGNYAEQITLIEGSKHIWLSSTTWVRDNDIRLWTVADAKDGDVLATDNGWTCIFKAFDGCVFSSYCFMDFQNWFYEFGSEAHTPDSRINGNIHPATKEQRDLFFKRMREAGYQWNPDKKELRKIIEPKFNVLDWIILNDGSSIVPIQVYRLKKDRYLVTNMLGSKGQVMINRQDEWRLWTIQDAKDGDVLVCYSEAKGSPIEQTGIFKQYVGQHGGCSNTFLAHTGIDWDGNVIINGYMGSTDILPATKEQHEHLFQKIKESGYEWDANEKELLSAVPKFKAGDWITDGNITIQIEDVRNDSYTYSDGVLYSTRTADKVYHLWSIADAKDGDVLFSEAGNPFLFCEDIVHDGLRDITAYCGIDTMGNFLKSDGTCWTHDLPKPATRGQRDLLFAKMREAGYSWDEKKKELCKTIDEPIFKVGDEIFRPACNEYFKIKDIEKDNGTVWYVTTRTRITYNDGRTGGIIRINARYQNEYNIAPKSHYDISNFHEGMPVLVRDDNSDEWNYLFFSHYRKKFSDHFFAGGNPWCQCVPFSEDTKHLLGTTDPCDECYVNW